MKKLFAGLIALVMLAGCSEDKLRVIHNNDRVSLLEARADLNEANDALLAARVSSLEVRMSTAEQRLDGLDSSLADFMNQTASDIADLRQTDEELAERLDTHAAVIGALAGQIVVLHAKDVLLNSKIESLKTRVVALENEIQQARQGYPSLNARLDAMQSSLNSLSGSVNSLQANVLALNMFAALQTLTNGYVQYQISQLDSRIDSNTADIATLTASVQSLTTQVNTISANYVSQSSLSTQLSNLQSTVQNFVLSQNYVTQSQLADAIAAIELLPGPQGPQGVQGPAGPAGIAGAQGPQGQPGVNGSTSGMSAVKLCAADNAAHPEYGFVVGDSIYAVYYGVVNGTLSAFLARLNPGSYVTTNDNTPCSFTVSYSGGNSYIDGVQVNSPTASTPVSGTCLVKKIQDYGTEKHYQFSLIGGAGLVGDYKVVVGMSNNSSTLGTNNNGNFSFSGGNYSFTPINSATSFQIYATGGNTGSIIQTAKVVKVSTNQELTCTVNNSI